MRFLTPSRQEPGCVDYKESVKIESKADLKRLYGRFLTEKVDYDIFEDPEETKADILGRRLFVENELDIVGGFKNDYLAKYMNGRNEDEILVGQWKYHKVNGLYVRFEAKAIGGLALAMASHSGTKCNDWTYDLRLDCQEDKGFFHADNLSMPSMKEAIKLSEKFTESLEGYMTVARARIPGLEAVLRKE